MTGRIERLREAGDKIVDILRQATPTSWVVSGMPSVVDARYLGRYIVGKDSHYSFECTPNGSLVLNRSGV